MITPRRALALRAGIVAGLTILLGFSLTGCNEDDVEKQLGEASAASVEDAYGVDRDPLMAQWLNDIGQTCVSHSRRQDLPYEFRVIDTSMVNAFAAPYGHIYVTRGFLDFVGTEDEVWMVVAHEVGHIVERDSIKSLKRSLIWSILNAILTSKSQTAGDIAGIGLGLLSLRYSRVDEYEADDFGTRLSYVAGYDPHMGIVFFDRLMTKLEKRRPASWEVYFMTHPPTERRIERQSKRPELDPDNVEALTQIGTGYLLRAQPAKAAELLDRAAGLDPNSVDIHTSLGDAYSARGEFELGRRQYDRALELSSGNHYATRRLTALSDAQPWSLPGVGQSGQEHAQELLARASEVGTATSAMHVSSRTYGAAVNNDLLGLRAQVKGINERLMALGDEDVELTEGLKELVARGSTSVARATESVYVLDSVNDDFEAMDTEMDGLLSACTQRLQAAQRGEGDPTELPAIRNAITELNRAAGTTQLAMTEAPTTLTLVKQAQSAASNTTSLLEQLVRMDKGRDLVADQLRAAATHTSQQAVDALHAVRRAKRQSTKARGHALVARLNLLGAGVGPYLEGVLDQQVAHFMMCPPAQVRALRAEGVGYGEAAAAIAAARSIGGRPDHFIIQDGKPVSPIGSAMAEGASVQNANVLLKLLGSAMESEREAAAAGQG